MRQATEDISIFPETSYLFEVLTVQGMGDIEIGPTQWDLPGEITINGTESIKRCLRHFFREYGYGMRGKPISLDIAAPMDIEHALAMGTGQENATVNNFEVVFGYVPDELPASVSLDTGDQGPEKPVFESAAYIQKLSEQTGIAADEAEKRWKKAKKIAEEQTGMSESDGDEYWAYVTGVFKKSMGVMESAYSPWVGFDLDGTLAETSEEFELEIGPPIEPMLARLEEYLDQGDTVKIFTARAADPKQIPLVREWLDKLGLGFLEITNEKDPGMVKLYDDRAVSVEKNTGVVGPVFESAGRLVSFEGDECGLPFDRKSVVRNALRMARAFFGKAIPNRIGAERIKIQINRNGVRKACGGRDIRKIIVVSKLDQLLRKAIYTGSEYPEKKDRRIKLYHRFEVPILFSGKREVVSLLVREDTNGFFHYNHHFVGIKKDLWRYSAGSPPEAGLAGPTAHKSLAKKIDPVNENVKNFTIEGDMILESAVSFKKKQFKLQDSYQFQGMPISVENKKGTYREGVDPDGHKWKTKMHFDYGYIRKTKGEDNEGIDVYVGTDRSAKHVYIVKQHKIEKVKKWNGEYCPECGEHVHDCACKEFFDEDKVFIGFANKQAVIQAYGKQYDSPLFMGPISTMAVEDFRDLVTGPKEKVKLPLQFVGEAAGTKKIVFTGEELGKINALQELRKKAFEFARRFLGKAFLNTDTGKKIRINRNGIRKVLGTKDRKKVIVVTKLDQMLRIAKYQGAEMPEHNKENIKAFHRFLVKAIYQGKPEKISILVREDVNGLYHYNHHFVGKNKGLPVRTVGSNPKGNDLGLAVSKPFDKRIKQNNKNVKKNVFEAAGDWRENILNATTFDSIQAAFDIKFQLK